MEDYYKILGVPRNATQEEIKRAYRILAKLYHPDVNPEGAEYFKKVNEAYKVLSNENLRANYNYRQEFLYVQWMHLAEEERKHKEKVWKAFFEEMRQQEETKSKRGVEMGGVALVIIILNFIICAPFAYLLTRQAEEREWNVLQSEFTDGNLFYITSSERVYVLTPEQPKGYPVNISDFKATDLEMLHKGVLPNGSKTAYQVILKSPHKDLYLAIIALEQKKIALAQEFMNSYLKEQNSAFGWVYYPNQWAPFAGTMAQLYRL